MQVRGHNSLPERGNAAWPAPGPPSPGSRDTGPKPEALLPGFRGQDSLSHSWPWSTSCNWASWSAWSFSNCQARDQAAGQHPARRLRPAIMAQVPQQIARVRLGLPDSPQRPATAQVAGLIVLEPGGQGLGLRRQRHPLVRQLGRPPRDHPHPEMRENREAGSKTPPATAESKERPRCASPLPSGHHLYRPLLKQLQTILDFPKNIWLSHALSINIPRKRGDTRRGVHGTFGSPEEQKEHPSL